MFELIQVPVQVALEVPLDVALRDRLGVDVDAGSVDT
jgi:hypothetical protein